MPGRRPVALTSARGGDRGAIRGRLVVPDPGHGLAADELVLDASTADDVTSPYVDGQRAAFSKSDVSSDHAGRTCCPVVGPEPVAGTGPGTVAE